MFTTNEKRPSRSWKKSILLIGCLLLVLLGAIYWQRTTEEAPAPAVMKATKLALEKPTSRPNAMLTADSKANSAQSLPVELSVNKPSVVKQVTRLSKVGNEAEHKHVPDLSKATALTEREPDAPIAQPVAAAPVATEARPKTAEYASISQPVELKPVVQPIPVAAAVTSPVSTSVPLPITASATPLPKRKAKNDEDVEIDPEWSFVTSPPS